MLREGSVRVVLLVSSSSSNSNTELNSSFTFTSKVTNFNSEILSQKNFLRKLYNMKFLKLRELSSNITRPREIYV